MPRKTFEIDGQRYIVIPYTGFRDLGVDAEPQVPLEVVPLYACVEDSLAEPLRQVKNREETLRDRRADILSAVVMGAKSKIREGSEIREGISYEGKLGFPFMLFRGERREEYSIQPTLLRLLNQVIPQHYRYTMRKDVRIERALAWKIRLALLVSDRVWLTKMRARAAARHYGAPSMLLDFTFDPRVAAYFAHPPIRDSERADFEAGTIPVGLIYGLRYDTLQRFFPIQSLFLERGSGHAFTFHFSTTTIRAPYLTFNENKKKIEMATCMIDLRPHVANMRVTFRAVAVPSIERIRAQQGLFIELDLGRRGEVSDAFRLWYLLDFLAEKWCFLRRDAQFEAPPSVTGESLFPNDQRLLRWAEAFG